MNWRGLPDANESKHGLVRVTFDNTRSTVFQKSFKLRAIKGCPNWVVFGLIFFERISQVRWLHRGVTAFEKKNQRFLFEYREKYNIAFTDALNESDIVEKEIFVSFA